MNQCRTCGRCGVSFSINDRGRFVVEEGFATTRLGRSLPDVMPWKRATKAWKSLAGEVGSTLGARWRKLSRSWRALILWGGSGCVVVLMLCAALSRWSSSDDAPREHAESLQVRAELVCHALLLGDPAVLTGLSSRDTQDDSARWLQRIRPPHWPSSTDLANTSQVDLRTLFKSIKNKRAAVYYTIRTRAEDTEITGTLCWTLGHDGRWQLDGRRTLDELAMARSTD